eukprot:SAG31_NODE_15653_length_744_cov_1.119380_1_plen_131_part_10
MVHLALLPAFQALYLLGLLLIWMVLYTLLCWVFKCKSGKSYTCIVRWACFFGLVVTTAVNLYVVIVLSDIGNTAADAGLAAVETIVKVRHHATLSCLEVQCIIFALIQLALTLHSHSHAHIKMARASSGC